MNLYLFIFTVFGLLKYTFQTSIDDFGAVSEKDDVPTALRNSEVIKSAFITANQTDRLVLIPPKRYYIFPMNFTDFHNLTIRIEGTLISKTDISAWPRNDRNDYLHILNFNYSSYLTFTGGGEVDGDGYSWWWYTIFNELGGDRPHMLLMTECYEVIIENLTFRNSPQFHILLNDVENFTIRRIKIRVDVDAQKNMTHTATAKKTSFLLKMLLWLNVPTFPLNTDGIDPNGRNVHIHDVDIENFDDAVAVKPGHGGNKFSQCSENILVENSTVSWGVGLTIGSVPPNEKVNCVRNVTFRNIKMHHPLKALYVKTNPGVKGSGIIENILYENIEYNTAVWWGIYIGPQQQKQPDGGGPGCMLYPLIKECETQPRVPMRNITLRNVTGKGGILFPGIIRCNETAPCTGFIFDRVNIDPGWIGGSRFICENVYGDVEASTPDPGCFKKGN